MRETYSFENYVLKQTTTSQKYINDEMPLSPGKIITLRRLSPIELL